MTGRDPLFVENDEPRNPSVRWLGTARAYLAGGSGSVGSRVRDVLPLVGMALSYGALLVIDRRVPLLWTPVPLWWPLVFLVAATFLLRRVPPMVTALWALGLLSYVWSLTPGNTLLAALWTAAILAMAAAGRNGGVLLAVAAYLELQNLESALALNQFQLQSYVSGSVHYLLGAKALVVLAPALAGSVLTRRSWLRWPLWALATVACFGALMSGSRGVYVPLAIVLALVVLRLGRHRQARLRLIVALIAMAALIVAVDRLLPYHPVSEALTSKASLQMQEASLGAAGGFTQRLRFWDQGLHMALAHPLGVGLGGFKGTIHAFQRFPMVWSSSPHDVFVETLATLGWPGLALLLVVLVSALVRGWRSERWPWALALIGIWFTLAVDVTADYANVLAIAFATVGACFGPVAQRRRGQRLAWQSRARSARVASNAAAIVAGLALTAWWFAPCSGPSCALDRWRGVAFRSAAAVRSLPADARPAFFHRLEELYPVSLWVVQLEERYATSQAQRRCLARQIATRFPLQSWRNYLDWAQLSLATGDSAQARLAVERGLAVFGPDDQRFPERRRDPQGFAHWLDEAQQILAETAKDATPPPPAAGGR